MVFIALCGSFWQQFSLEEQFSQLLGEQSHFHMSKTWYLGISIVRYEGTLLGSNPLAWKMAIRYFIVRKMFGQPVSCTFTEPTPQRQVIFAATPGISLYKYNMYYLQCTYVYYDVICKNISLLSQSHYLSSQECRECKE